VFLLVSRSLIDDAYITTAYARNLAFHLHWGMIADETANSATSPHNVIALGAITAVVRDGVVAVGVLFVGSAVLAARWLAELAADTGLDRALPVSPVITSCHGTLHSWEYSRVWHLEPSATPTPCPNR
jgi:hypothetical protein